MSKKKFPFDSIALVLIFLVTCTSNFQYLRGHQQLGHLLATIGISARGWGMFAGGGGVRKTTFTICITDGKFKRKIPLQSESTGYLPTLRTLAYNSLTTRGPSSIARGTACSLCKEYVADEALITWEYYDLIFSKQKKITIKYRC